MKSLNGTRPPSRSSAAQLEREFERECVELFGEVVHLLGVPRSVGQIYGVLFASPEPLSFSDIVARLGISKGSASQGLHVLRSLGAIQLAPRPADRPAVPAREYFVPEFSLRKLVSGVLQERLAPLAAEGKERLVRLRRIAEGDARRELLLDRVEQLETWRRRFRSVLPVLNVLLGPKLR